MPNKIPLPQTHPLKFRLQHFKILKTSLIILMVSTLIYLLIPNLTKQSPSFNSGDIAPQNIVAEEDFWLEDNLSTAEKRIFAEDDVLPVYDLDPEIFKLKQQRILQAFNLMDEFYRKYIPEFSHKNIGGIKKLRLKKLEESPLMERQNEEFLKIIGISLSKKNQKTLKKHYYKPKLRNQIIYFLKSIMDNGIINNRNILDVSGKKKIIIRDTDTGKEKIIPDNDTVLDLSRARLDTKESIKIETEDEEIQKLITEFSEKLIEPNLTYNDQEVTRRKTSAIASVEPIYFHIKKGEPIVRVGEKITEQHLLKLKALSKSQGYHNYFNVILGISVLIILVLFLTWAYLSRYKSAYINDKNLLLIGVILLSNFAIVKIFMLLVSALGNYIPNIDSGSYIYTIPFATGTMLTVILFGVDLGIIFSILTFFLTGILTITHTEPSYALVALAASLITVSRLNQHKQRSGIIMTGLIIGVVNAMIITQLNLINNLLFTAKGGFDIIFCLSGGFTTAMFVSVLLPVFESSFKMTSDIRLLELADTNHPLISQLVIKAPGTYQHSYLVANLAEAAAEVVGVNPLLVRVGAYFHDIGKMKKSNYFIENQDVSHNRHDHIPPSLSSLILIAHVKDGIELAKEYHLTPRIIDFIREHHGTSVIRYFYQKAKQNEEPDIDLIDKEDFRYPGPKPQSKETAILLLADSVEAASRAMDNPTSPRLKNLVQEIINEKFVDGQLDECNLSLKELNLITESFMHILLGTFHSRINYPVERRKNTNNDFHQKPTKKNKNKNGINQKENQESFENPELLQ